MQSSAMEHSVEKLTKRSHTRDLKESLVFVREARRGCGTVSNGSMGVSRFHIIHHVVPYLFRRPRLLMPIWLSPTHRTVSCFHLMSPTHNTRKDKKKMTRLYAVLGRVGASKNTSSDTTRQ